MKLKKPKIDPLNLTVENVYKNRPRRWIFNLALVLFFLVLIIYSWSTLGIDVKDRDFMKSLVVMAKGFANPNVDFLLGRGDFAGESGVPYLILQTIAIAFVGTLIGAILAVPFGFLTARNVVGKYSKIGEILLIIIRTFPEILLALVLVRFSGTGAFTGTMAVGIHSIGMIGKLYAESIENIDPGPIEALDACGSNTFTRISKAIMPQVFPDFMSTVLYRFDINIRTATVLGVVAAGGIGAPMTFAISGWYWSDLSSILIAIIIMVVVVDIVSSLLRKKLL
ncbi:phosphonate ABC transporter, permease protein PhnE [bacterium]|jgi:phosphonate transport system permease protein|nr:phosphonate ABC transporter, permease protein PhnE [bacterium]